MTPGTWRISFTTLILLACWACSAPPQKGTQITNYERLDDSYGYVVELAQGWTDDTQQAFYNTPQGSEIMPYAWLVALEQKGSTASFLAEPNIERFRYLPRKQSPANPDGLPVGGVYGVSYDDCRYAFAFCDRLRMGPALGIYEPNSLRTTPRPRHVRHAPPVFAVGEKWFARSLRSRASSVEANCFRSASNAPSASSTQRSCRRDVRPLASSMTVANTFPP